LDPLAVLCWYFAVDARNGVVSCTICRGTNWKHLEWRLFLLLLHKILLFYSNLSCTDGEYVGGHKILTKLYNQPNPPRHSWIMAFELSKNWISSICSPSRISCSQKCCHYHWIYHKYDGRILYQFGTLVQGSHKDDKSNFPDFSLTVGTLLFVMLTLLTTGFFFRAIIFSSPEHKVLMVSYCDRPLSVVVRKLFYFFT